METEGLRISAERAGRSNGDEGFDDDEDGEAWSALGPPGTHLNGGKGRRHSRRGARAARRGRTGDMPERAPAPAIPAVTARPRSAAPSVAALKRRRQRRRRRRTLIACTLVTSVCTFVAGVGYVYLHSRLDRITRVDLASLAGDSSGSAVNVLLVGSDSQADQSAGPSSDTIMILHYDRREPQSAIVSVPRDLLIPIAGTANLDRVHTAFAQGGPDQLVATLQEGLGLTIHHYMQVDYEGFKDVADAVGGVTLYLPYPARDPASGLGLDRGGCVELDGAQGLSWMRSRQMEFLVNGTWQADGRGDLGRIERQQDFVRRTMKEALSAGVTSPLRLNRVIGAGGRHVTLDSALSSKDLSELGRRYDSVDPAEVSLSTLPTTAADVAGRSVLVLQPARAQPILEVLRGQAARVPEAPTTETTVAPPATPAAGLKASDVKVRVLNGVGTPGAAGKAATSLTTVGFTVADKGDAPAISAKTTISYAAGQLAKAQLLQSALVTPAVLREDVTLKAVDVNLVLGADYTGVKSGISSGTSSASTTIARTAASSTSTSTPSTTSTAAAAAAAASDPAPLPGAVAAPPC